MQDWERFRKPKGIFQVRRIRRSYRLAFATVVICCLTNSCRPQEFTPKEREQAQAMLKDVADDVRRYYYDQHLHGIDWDAEVRKAKEKIDNENSLNRAMTDIATLLSSLNDSHTFFLPPPRPYKHDYGFQMQMIGDQCYVTHVRSGTDAETKGLRPGDEILSVNGYKPTRDDFWRMQFVFWVLRPQPGLSLSVRGVDGSNRRVDVAAKLRQLPKVKNLNEMNAFDVDREIDEDKRSVGVRYANRGHDLLIIKLPEFMTFSSEADDIVSKMKDYKAVIFDLRGDPGGSEEMVQSILGGVFEHKVKIGDRVGRGATKPIETEHHFNKFTGNLAVLIDSQSASASEIFSRVIQLEKRGVVIGDQSAGAVMEALRFVHRTKGTTEDSFLVYGAEVTKADIIMSDGQSLERKGVLPDTVVLPTASDLAGGRDPVLAKAAELLSVKMTPEEAGKLFPYAWPED